MKKSFWAMLGPTRHKMAHNDIYHVTMQFSNIRYTTTYLILKWVIKYEAFIKMFIQNTFLCHERIMKINKDILRVVFGSARYENMSACHEPYLDRSKDLPCHTRMARHTSRALEAITQRGTKKHCSPSATSTTVGGTTPNTHGRPHGLRP